MDIKVMDERSSPACTEPDYVRVAVCPDPGEDTTTFATIERVVRKANAKPSAPAMRVKKLVEKQPMSLDAAVGLATLYAESKNIRLVLTAGGGSSN